MLFLFWSIVIFSKVLRDHSKCQWSRLDLEYPRTEGGKMPRTKNPNPTPISERVCTRGHIGQYRKRGTAIACHECSKIAVSKFRERGGVPHSPVPLEERVCKHGHVGQYKVNKDGHKHCVVCTKLAYKAFYKRQQDSTSRVEWHVSKLMKRREELVAQLAEVVARIAFEESIIKQRQERE